MFPIYWMLVCRSRTNDAIARAAAAVRRPAATSASNLGRLFDNSDAHFATRAGQLFVVAGALTVSTWSFSSLAGFAFAKLQFRGRNALLLVIIATMMVPGAARRSIPLYMLMTKLHWQGTLPAVIVPFLVTGFGVFMMRQYTAQAVPDELIEAARVDGCSTFRIYWTSCCPRCARPPPCSACSRSCSTGTTSCGRTSALNDPETPTVQVSLSRLSGGYYTDYALVMAGTLIATLPLLLVFVVFGRQIIGGIMEGAVKA